MYLYVLRHGKAGEGYPDEVRELTDRGREDVGAVLSGCAENMEPLKQILCSPLVRARQTAEIVANILRFDGDICENEHITPWGSPQEFLDSLDEGCRSALIASHQPYASTLVEYLTGQSIAMRTSAIAAIDMEYPSEGGGQLLWYRDPKTD